MHTPILSSMLKKNYVLYVPVFNDCKVYQFDIFQKSLEVLMQRMESSTPIFVRCLKPNHTKQSGQLDTEYVLAQVS